MLLLALSAHAAPAWKWQTGPGCRYADLTVALTGEPGFTRMPMETTGITFSNALAQQRHLTNQILLNGSGVTAGDVDGDGWCDLYFCGLDGPNVLYRNLGHWQFQDITAAAGVAGAGLDATGAALADLDGDGDLELLVNSVGQGTHVFFNDGAGRFAEAAPPLNPGKGGTSFALGDVDGDGFLDIYVANYRTSALMDLPNTRFSFKEIDGRQAVDKVNGHPVTEPPWANRFVLSDRGGIDELGEVDVLFLNRGGTNFVPVSFTDGTFLDEDGRPLAAPPFEWGLSVMFRDLNGDRQPDIYVCNDFDSPDRIWLNLGWGRFRALPRLAIRHSSLFSMSMDFGDLNRDGFDDFIVLDMLNRERVSRLTTMSDRKPPVYVGGDFANRPQYMQTVLQWNRGDGTFAETGQLAGVAACDWAWNVVCLDVDLDGWEDLLIVNGNERDARNMDVANVLRANRTARKMSAQEILQARVLFPPSHSANLAFRNRHDGTFEDAGRTWGFNDIGVSHGLALADLDNDGDLDVAINNLNAAAGIFRNNTPAPRLAVRLKGIPPNTHGVGARIQVSGSELPVQSQEVIAGGRYLSSDEPLRVFAATSATSDLQIEVFWRSGRRSLVRGVHANRQYEIDEAAAFETYGPQPAGPVRRARPWFEDQSPVLAHAHFDTPFNDLDRQPLLPKQLSGLGPGLAWADVDGNGWDDLIVASGKGGHMGVLLNRGQGTFAPSPDPLFSPSVLADQTAIVAWRTESNTTLILAGSSNYEDSSPTNAGVHRFDRAGKRVEDAVPGSDSTTGPLALADVDSDGDLDLFVGGRVRPGKYPAPAASRLFRQAGNRFELDAANTARLAEVGMVSGAVFSDLDGDGDPDLVLACEWGSIRVFRNDHGTLTDATREWGLQDYLGWWNGVATGDFDGDGRPDIVAANWGRNTRYEPYRAQPLQVYFGDLDENGTSEIIETYYDPQLKKQVPERGLSVMAAAVPYVGGLFKTHRDYALASVQEAFGAALGRAKMLSANWLESTVFLNRGNRFEARPLPVEAQFAPAFAVCVADLDHDGCDDIFLSQNFFAVATGTPRYDAGCGLCLRGDGQGGFRAVSVSESGIKIDGEQRGAALADYDRDGRVDLAVAQYGGATCLYRNVGASPGRRIALRGPDGNPDAIGATLRIIREGKPGPAREIQAGSGYWSQNSGVQILGTPGQAEKIWIRWPGGKVTQTKVPLNAQEIRIGASSAVQEWR